MKNAIGLYFALSQCIPPEHAMRAMKVLENWPDAIPSAIAEPVQAVPASVTEWQEPNVPSDQTQVSQDVGSAETGAETETVPVAADVRVANMPASPRARANIRMGRRADGKSRP